MPRLVRTIALAPLVLGACSSEPEPEPVFALYGAQAFTRLTPYPSNRYTKADPTSKTGRRVDIGTATTADAFVADPTFAGTVAALNRLDGFSTVGPLIVGFSKEIDETTADGSVALVDVDDASPNKGKAMPVFTLYFTTTDTESLVEDYTLLVHPVEPLRPRTRYAFVVTNGIKAKTGPSISATGEMRALLRDEPGEYAESVRAALPLVASGAGIERDAIVLASVFTTEPVRDVIEAMASDRRAAPPPKLASPFTLRTKPEGAEKRARFVGSYEAAEYRRPKPDGTFDVANDRATPQSTVALETYLDFADATRSGPRPIVIYGHGLGGDKDGAWGTADRLKDLDVAVIAIDAPEHGSRSDPPTPDGKSDVLRSVTGFFAANPDTKKFDMERVRDNFRQMALDQLELVRLIGTLGTLDVLPIGAPDGIPDLDPSRILYLGHSFGSVLGPTVGALAPRSKPRAGTSVAMASLR